jgi:hypothetical protein
MIISHKTSKQEESKNRNLKNIPKIVFTAKKLTVILRNRDQLNICLKMHYNGKYDIQ